MQVMVVNPIICQLLMILIEYHKSYIVCFAKVKRKNIKVTFSIRKIGNTMK